MRSQFIFFVLICLFGVLPPASAQTLVVKWDKTLGPLTTTPTLQIVVNPPLRRGSAIHDEAYRAVKDLGADYVRYVPWLPYPKLAVAELEPPTKEKTSWDFSLIDPMTEDVVNATQGHSLMLNFSTIPAWLFRTPKPVTYPDNPDQPTWEYTEGTELRDPSLKELGDYYARLVSWYVNGGFVDENGKRHDSGHHYKVDYWEVLNEPDLEHQTTPEQYTERYDAIVSAVRRVAPGIKFVGLSLAFPSNDPRYFEYFLDPKNHKAGIPLDMISYHFYAVPTAEQTPEIQQYTFFDQADRFITTVRYIEAIRKRLSPSTRTTVNEIGAISADDLKQGERGHVMKPILESYWHLAGANYAYVFGNLASLGIGVAGESQLVGYPTQFPSVSLLDWNTGRPNARFRVLELLKTNLTGGGNLVEGSITGPSSPDLYALPFSTPNGKHKALVVNKRDRDISFSLDETASDIQCVDRRSKDGPPRKAVLDAKSFALSGLAVCVVAFK